MESGQFGAPPTPRNTDISWWAARDSNHAPYAQFRGVTGEVEECERSAARNPSAWPLESAQRGAGSSRCGRANVSSGLGSLAATPGGFSYAYCASKSALSMLTVLMHREPAGDGVTVVSLDPGWIRADMGGAFAPLDPTDSVRARTPLGSNGLAPLATRGVPREIVDRAALHSTNECAKARQDERGDRCT